MRRIIYTKGEVVGSMIFINEIRHRVRRNGDKIRRAEFLCTCGNKTEADISQVKSNHIKSCGCLRIKMLRLASGYHGYNGTRYYKAWSNIKNRCYNNNSKDYYYYGARGISLSMEFINNPVEFCEYVKSLHGADIKGNTIDRINNDGNYERGNIRWASRHVQSINRRKQNNNKSGYTGICINIGEKNSGKYISSITNNGTKHHLGMFDTALSAANARNKYIIENNLPHKLSKKI